MIRRLFYCTIFLVLFFGPVLFTTSLAHGDSSTTLFFPGIREAVKASGLVYSANATIEIPAKWEYDSTRDGIFLSVSVPKKLAAPATLVSGVIMDSDSSLVFGPLTFADLPDPRAAIPMCDANADKIQVARSQQALLESLVEIRERRKEVAVKKLDELAPPELIERLKRLERGFGFTYKEELSLNLPPEELATRLDTLFYAINRYEFHKERKSSNSVRYSSKQLQNRSRKG